MSYKPIVANIQSGQVTVGSTGTSATTITGTQTLGVDSLTLSSHPLVFPTPFTTPPHVEVCLEGATGGQTSISNVYVEDGSVTTTGCNIIVGDFDFSLSVTVNWIAFEDDLFIQSETLMLTGQVTGISTSANIVSTNNINADLVNNHQVAVSFGHTFKNPPIVTLTVQGNNNGHGAVLNAYVVDGSVTTTGFNAILTDFTSSANVSLNWLAVAQ